MFHQRTRRYQEDARKILGRYWVDCKYQVTTQTYFLWLLLHHALLVLSTVWLLRHFAILCFICRQHYGFSSAGAFISELWAHCGCFSLQRAEAYSSSPSRQSRSSQEHSTDESIAAPYVVATTILLLVQPHLTQKDHGDSLSCHHAYLPSANSS